MSKWTWDKIRKQIKRGDTFSYNHHKDEIIFQINSHGFDFFNSELNCLDGYESVERWKSFKFYRDGKEILPEPDRELIKFTEKLVDSFPRFITEDNEAVYQSNEITQLSKSCCNYLIEEIPNPRVLYRFKDTLEISHWG